MRVKDNLDLSYRNPLDILVDGRRWLVGGVILITAVLSFFIPSIQTDPSLKSGVDTNSEGYIKYQEFIKSFGNEEFILIALKNNRGAGDPRMLHSLETITRSLAKRPEVAEVVSLSDLKVFQKRDSLYGSFPILEVKGGETVLPDPAHLESMRKALPVTDYLLSENLKTLGILVRVKEKWRFSPEPAQEIVADVTQLLKENGPPGTTFRIVGPALIRQAIVKYSIQTGIIFGVLCMLIATGVSVYIFRSAKLTGITNVILALCVFWIVGLMALLGIPLNSTTALSFGFIPITTLEIVIHMVVRYRQFHSTTPEKAGAVKQCVRWLARPCFICSATTAVGFGTLMVSSIPMVRQLGFIMAVGIMLSYCLAFVLTPAFFMVMKSLDARDQKSVLQDGLERFLHGVENSIFNHHRLYVLLGAVITIVLFAGTPLIRSDIQILRMLSPTTTEVKDIQFVEKNLTQVNGLELFLEAEPGAFKRPEVWERVLDLNNRLGQIPEVAATDSLLPLLNYLNGLLDPEAKPYKELFSRPDLIPQLLELMSFSEEGRRVKRRFVTEGFDRLRISVRIKNSPSVPIGRTIEDIRVAAQEAMDGAARVTVTGDLAVFAGQTSNLITDQIWSMMIAAVLITILMMIQMGSPMLGLISLIPNIPPVAAVFGIMGWFGISLDGVTIFAATVAVGLAVDNTIHYLTQLKREIRLNAEAGMEGCVRSAYRLTARQIASYSCVTLMGFLALAVSPFRPVVLFGLLGFSSIFLGLFGDLIFVQSLILSSGAIRRSILRLIEKETGREREDPSLR
jgi:uncharacterized protein